MSERLRIFDTVSQVNTARAGTYGHPSIHFDRVARLKEVVQECPDPKVRHTLDMILDKVARLIKTPDHLDSWVDIAGYARCGVMVTDPPVPVLRADLSFKNEIIPSDLVQDGRRVIGG